LSATFSFVLKDLGRGTKFLTDLLMYQHYFGFSDLPFRVTPEPAFFYSNAVYQEALATLRYGIEARKGFIVITGEVGTGKTTLLKILMRRAEPIIHTAFVFHPRQTFTELLRFIVKDLGLPASANDKSVLLEQLNRYLINQLKRGHIVALLFDEAQQLSDDSLEELRLLSNFETDTEKLVQIVLMGQPELEQRLDRPELRQLKQRVALRCRLAPLGGHEIQQYIEFRLKTVGYDAKELFDRKALDKIARHSRGIPRLINVICDNALLNAYATGKKTISPEIIEEVATDLQLNVPIVIEPPPLPSNVPQQQNDAITRAVQRLEHHKREPAASLHRPKILSAVAIVLLFVVAVAAGSVALYPHLNSVYSPHVTVIARDHYAPTRDYLSNVTAGVKNNYEQSREYLAHVAAEAKEFVDTQLQNIKHANRIADVATKDAPKETPAADRAPNFVDTQLQNIKHANRIADVATKDAPKETPAADRAPAGNGGRSAAQKAAEFAANFEARRDVRTPTQTPAQMEKPGATEPLIHRPEKPRSQRSEPQRYSLKEKTTEFGSVKAAKKDARFVRGHFEVVRDVVVFERPTMEAAIIATLPPRTWVRVEERVGNYLRVLSLNDPWVRGYVHTEDASFEYIGFAQTDP
jgi:general secretion pathway protein A